MPAPRRAGTTAPSSAGSHRSSFSTAGPATQVSATLIRPPLTLNTRPVTSCASALASQTTIGAMLAGEPASNPVRSLISAILVT